MMANRNLLAPKPHRATLVQQPSARTDQLLQALKALGEEDVEIIAMRQLSANQAYELRRQSRNRGYKKNQLAFYEGANDIETDSDQHKSIPDTSRTPSRYLKALLKFEPQREEVIALLFQDKEEKDLELSLETVLPPLIQLASPAKKRYAYKTAEPASDGSCPDCTKDLTALVSFQSINIRSTKMC
jgi:hypothetical protein